METENESSKKCPETENIYTDIIEFDLGTEVEKLREENRQLEDHIDSLEVDIEKLADALRQLKAIQENLAQNISSLYLTAKAELSRKDRIIEDLRRKLDDVVFRRGKRKPLSRSPDTSSKKGRYEQPGESVDNFHYDYESNPPYRTGHLERRYDNDDRGNEPNNYYKEERSSDSAFQTYERRNMMENNEYQHRKRYSNHDRNSNYDRTEFTSRSWRNLSNTSKSNYRYDPRIEKLRRESNSKIEEYRFSSEEEDVRNKRLRTPKVEKRMTEKESRGEQTRELKSDKKKHGTAIMMKVVQKLEQEMMEKKASSHSSLEDLSQITEPNIRRANYFVDHMEHIMNNVLLDIRDTKLITVSKKEENSADARSASSGVLSGDESASRESFDDPYTSHNNFPSKSSAVDDHNPPLGQRQSKIANEQLKQYSNEKRMKESEAEISNVVGGPLEPVSDTKISITAKNTKIYQNIENKLKSESARLEKDCSNKVQNQLERLPETSTKDEEMMERNGDISKTDDEMVSEKKEEDDSSKIIEAVKKNENIHVKPGKLTSNEIINDITVNEKIRVSVVGKEMELSTDKQYSHNIEEKAIVSPDNDEENKQLSSIGKIKIKSPPKTPKLNPRYKIPKKDKELTENNPLRENFDSAEVQRNIVLVSLDEHKTPYEGRFKSVDEENVNCRKSRTKSVPRSFPREKPKEKSRSKSRDCRSRLGDQINKYPRRKSFSGENEYRKCYEERKSRDHTEYESQNYNEHKSRNYKEHENRKYEERKSRNYAEHENRNYNEHKRRNYEQHESRNYEERKSRNYAEHESRNYEERKSRNYDERKNRNYEDENKTSQKENKSDMKRSRIERSKSTNSEDIQMSTRSQRVGESSDKHSNTSVTKKSSGKQNDDSSHKNHQTVRKESFRQSSTAYKNNETKRESKGIKNIPTPSKSKTPEDLEISRITPENKVSASKMKCPKETEANKKKIIKSTHRKIFEAEVDEKITDIRMKMKSLHEGDASEKEKISDIKEASDKTGNHETIGLEIFRQKDSEYKEDEGKTAYPNNRRSMEILKTDKVHGIRSPFLNDDEDAEVECEEFPQNKSKTESNANTIKISNEKPEISRTEVDKQSNNGNIVEEESLENLNPGGGDKRKRISLLADVKTETKTVVNDTKNLKQRNLSLPEATPPESKEVECFSDKEDKSSIANSQSEEVPPPKSTETMKSIKVHLKKDTSDSIQGKSTVQGTHKRKRDNEILLDSNTSKHSKNINTQESSRGRAAEPSTEDEEVKYIEGLEKRNMPKIISQGINEQMPNLIPLKQTLLPKNKQDKNDNSSKRSKLQKEKQHTSKPNQKEELLQNNDSNRNTKPSKLNTVNVLSAADSNNTVGTKKAQKHDASCLPHSELRMSGTNVPVVLETGPLQTTNECSSSVAAQASARKRITPIRIGDSPVCSFENILQKNRMPSFAKELSAPNVSPLTLTHEGDIPLLHLEENHFQSLNDDGTQKSFDKSIMNLLDNLNMSNLDCDITKLGMSSEKNDNSKRAEESDAKPDTEIAGAAAPVSTTCDILNAPAAKPTNVVTASIPPSITSTPKQRNISERESSDIVQKSENVSNIDKSGDNLKTPTLNNSRNLTGLGRRRRARIVVIDKT